VIAGRAGDFLETIGHVRLRTEIEFHIRIDRKAVETLFTDAAPFAVRLQKSLINPEAGFLADGAFGGGESLFNLLNRQWRHRCTY
jgi:hypothetical protein